MTPDEVREIVRDEIAKLIMESGILDVITELVSAGLIPGLLEGLIPGLDHSKITNTDE